MAEDPPSVEFWVLVLECVLVLGGAWAYEGGGVRLGEFFASWALTTVILGFVASAAVPWTRGVRGGARWLAMTLFLGASGALLTAVTLTGILMLSVIRTGMTPSGDDIAQAFVVGGSSGLWLGAVAGLLSGSALTVVVLVVDGLRGVSANPDRPSARTLAGLAAVSALVLALVAESQHWSPTYLVTGCSAGCSAWSVQIWARMLALVLAVVAAGLGTLLVARHETLSWRAPVGLTLLVAALLSLSLGHTVFTSTYGPYFRRATLGLPPMPVPLTRELVDAHVVDHPGWMWHTVEVRWPDEHQEFILIGVGPFRPDTAGLVAGFAETAEAWQGDAIPGRR
jgi:hypothetical protein